MGDGDDRYGATGIVDLVDNAVISDANSPFGSSHKFLNTGRSRVAAQAFYGSKNRRDELIVSFLKAG
jgi:hypothetical protein